MNKNWIFNAKHLQLFLFPIFIIDLVVIAKEKKKKSDRRETDNLKLYSLELV